MTQWLPESQRTAAKIFKQWHHLFISSLVVKMTSGGQWLAKQNVLYMYNILHKASTVNMISDFISTLHLILCYSAVFNIEVMPCWSLVLQIIWCYRRHWAVPQSPGRVSIMFPVSVAGCLRPQMHTFTKTTTKIIIIIKNNNKIAFQKRGNTLHPKNKSVIKMQCVVWESVLGN